MCCIFKQKSKKKIFSQEIQKLLTRFSKVHGKGQRSDEVKIPTFQLLRNSYLLTFFLFASESCSNYEPSHNLKKSNKLSDGILIILFNLCKCFCIALCPNINLPSNAEMISSSIHLYLLCLAYFIQINVFCHSLLHTSFSTHLRVLWEMSQENAVLTSPFIN